MGRPLEASFEYLRPYLVSNDPTEELTAAKIYGLLVGYDERWQDAPYVIQDMECILSSDLYNPATGRKNRFFQSVGKIDVRAIDQVTGEKVLIDHKTSSQEISDFAAPFWKQLVIEGQINHYLLLEWLQGQKVDYALWDVIRKPSIAPKVLSQRDAAAVINSKMYFDFALDTIETERFEGNELRETPLMYSARLADDCRNVRPDFYFQRRKVPRLDKEIYEYGVELWGHAADIREARKTGRHPRNSGACFTYGTPCRYLGICSGYDTPDSERWTKAEWVHPELPILNNGQGTEYLTNSRIRTFQTCRQKHYFQYELGIKRVEEEEADNLFFGRMFHEALEQFFIALQKEQETTGNACAKRTERESLSV